jgi:hypothetical protein
MVRAERCVRDGQHVRDRDPKLVIAIERHADRVKPSAPSNVTQTDNLEIATV